MAELKSVAASSQSTSDKITNLQASVVALETQLKTQGAEAKQAALVQSLQWALCNATIGEFEYYDADYGGSKRSGQLVKNALNLFMRGKGMLVGNGSTLSHSYRGSCTEEERQAFRDKLSEHIHGLTGMKPRFVKQDNGAYAVWCI